MNERIPRIGDVVWYRTDPIRDGRHPLGQQVCAAMITAVHSHEVFNLAVFLDKPVGRLDAAVGFRSSVRYASAAMARSWFWRPGEESQPPVMRKA